MFNYFEPPANTEELPLYLQELVRRLESEFNNPSSYNADQLKDIDSFVNTRAKWEGIFVWDSTTKKPVWATGKSPADTWIFGDGTVAYSPAKSIINP